MTRQLTTNHREIKISVQYPRVSSRFLTFPLYPLLRRYVFPSSNAKSWLTMGACHDELNQIPLTKCRIYIREELRTEEIGPSLTGTGG